MSTHKYFHREIRKTFIWLPLLSRAMGPNVQSVFSLMGSLRVISLTVLVDSIYNILIFFAEKMCKSYSHFFSKIFQHICISLDVNFNELLTNDVVSFEQLGHGLTQSLSYIITVSAAMRFIPSPPALVLNRNTNTLGSVLKLYICK